MSPGTWRKGDGTAGTELFQQLAVISTAGSVEMSHVQPHSMGNGKWNIPMDRRESRAPENMG